MLIHMLKLYVDSVRRNNVVRTRSKGIFLQRKSTDNEQNTTTDVLGGVKTLELSLTFGNC